MYLKKFNVNVQGKKKIIDQEDCRNGESTYIIHLSMYFFGQPIMLFSFCFCTKFRSRHNVRTVIEVVWGFVWPNS